MQRFEIDRQEMLGLVIDPAVAMTEEAFVQGEIQEEVDREEIVEVFTEVEEEEKRKSLD